MLKLHKLYTNAIALVNLMTSLELRDVCPPDYLQDHRNIVAVIPYQDGYYVESGYVHDLILDELNSSTNPISDVDVASVIDVASETAKRFNHYADLLADETDDYFIPELFAYIAVSED